MTRSYQVVVRRPRGDVGIGGSRVRTRSYEVVVWRPRGDVGVWGGLRQVLVLQNKLDTFSHCLAFLL